MQVDYQGEEDWETETGAWLGCTGVTSVDRLNRILEMGLATRREGSLVKLKGRRMEDGKLVVATK